jgi:hypothetical protein
MAIQARFQADFSKFTSAVASASVKLKDFETDANKVQSSVQRIGDSFGGKKIIQDAELTARAIAEIGGASKLTAAEQSKVNATVTEAIAKYAALGKTAPQALTDLAAATAKVQTASDATATGAGRMSSVFGDMASQIKATALGFVSAQAIMGAVLGSWRALTGFVGDAVQSYASAEAAGKKMTTALQAQGTATPDVIADFNDLAATFQKTTIYSDDLINEMQALLTSVGDVAPGQMDKALTAATDLASGLGIDLRSAVLMVSKASEENVGALKKAGVALDETRVQGEGMSYILSEIQEKFGGQAQADAESYAGKITQIGNAWDNVKEAVGGAIVQHPLLTAALRAVKDGADEAGDGASIMGKAWGDTVALLPQWIVSIGTFATEVADANNTIAAAVANLPKTPKLFDAPTGDPLGDLMARSKKFGDELVASWTRGDAAAKKYADAVEAGFRRWSGANAQEAMGILDANFRRLAASGQLTERQIDGIVAEAIRLQGEGATLTSRLWDMVLATDALNPGLAKTAIDIGKIGTQSAITIPQLSALDRAIQQIGMKTKSGLMGIDPSWKVSDWKPPSLDEIRKGLPVGLFDTIFGSPKAFGASLSNAVIGALQGGGSPMGAAAGVAGQQLGTSVATSLSKSLLKDGAGLFSKALGGVLSSALPVVGSLIGPLAEKLWGSLFGTKGRDAVKDFAASMGGFDALHVQLNQLGADGERLWIKLTQGVGRNNPAEAANAIKAIEDALAAYKKKQEEAGDAAEDAAEKEIAAADKVRDAMQANVDALDDQIRSLEQSIANEAPEEVIGIVEAQTRAQIKAIAEQRAAAQKAIDDTAKDAADAADEAAQIIDTALAGRKYKIDVDVNLLGLPPGSTLPTGTPPREPILPPGTTVAPPAGSRAGGTAILQLDGRTLAEVVVPNLPGVVTRYGLGRG